MTSTACSLGGLVAIAHFLPVCSMPLAFSCVSPTARLAGEVAASTEFTNDAAAAVHMKVPMLRLDPYTMKRTAVVVDAPQLEYAAWWISRAQSQLTLQPYSLSSVFFCVGAHLETLVDLVARVPQCASTVRTLNLNARDDFHNRISSLGALSRLVHLRELLMKNTTVLPTSSELPAMMIITDELRSVLRGLRKLVIGDYHLVKRFPLQNLSEIEELDLSGTGATNDTVEAVSHCRRVRFLSLSSCSGIDRFTPLASLTCLTQLNLSYTRLDNGGLRELCSGCPHLVCAMLSSCGTLTDFSPLARLTQLGTLTVAHTRLGHFDLVRICALPMLEELDIHSCRAIHDFTPLAEALALRELDVHDTWVDDLGVASVARCAVLRCLNVSCCSAAENFSPLSRLSLLEELNLSYSAVRGVDLKEICTALSHLRVLVINGCHAVDDFTSLRHLPLLEELHACDTAFDDAALLAVSNSHRLSRLHIHLCVRVTTLAPLTGCLHLRSLGIGGTRFSSRSFEGECAALQGRGVQLRHQIFLLTAF